MMELDMHVVNVTLKQLKDLILKSIWQPSTMENVPSVKNVITKVLQKNHLSFTHSPIMMGLDTYVANVAIKQLGNRFSKPI